MHRSHVIRWLALVTWWTVACSDDSCNDMGCIDGVEVVFSEPLDAELAYTVTLRGDDLDILCDFDPSASLNSCATQGINLQIQGGKVIGFILDAMHPSALTISFSSGATVALQATVDLEYVELQPNGPDCPPSCRNATVDV